MKTANHALQQTRDGVVQFTRPAGRVAELTSEVIRQEVF
jgi:hypothetical protein